LRSNAFTPFIVFATTLSTRLGLDSYPVEVQQFLSLTLEKREIQIQIEITSCTNNGLRDATLKIETYKHLL
jgi:hypothetical protein